MSDLAQFDTAAASNAGFDLTLRDPATGKDLDIVVKVYGRDSDRFRSVQSRQNKVRIDKMRRAGRAVPVDADELEDEGIDLLAKCTIGWQNLDLDGRPLDFSEANAVMVYRRFPWIREQVDAAIGDRANFTTPRSAASSSLQSTTSVSE